MSQTTRCPSCQTRFKVVADQLRISDGWVRCGQCKQVFDASLSLETVGTEPMLPEMQLDRLRGPVERSTPQTKTQDTWGGLAYTEQSQPRIASPASFGEDGAIDDGFAKTQSGELRAPGKVAAPEQPAHVPAFLTARPAPTPGFVLGKTMAPDRVVPVLGQSESASAKAQPLARVRAPERASGEPVDKRQEPSWRSPAQQADMPAETEWQSLSPGGYELPAAHKDDSDSQWPVL
ncbi:MAG: MJ0042-type zinc finger domain-containing protein, partial [Giesbergeria sp.]